MGEIFYGTFNENYFYSLDIEMHRLKEKLQEQGHGNDSYCQEPEQRLGGVKAV